MGKIKDKNKVPSKVSRKKDGFECLLPNGLRSEQISFCFKYIIDNKNFNFKNNACDSVCYQKLFELVQEISNNTWLILSNRRKQQFGGFETFEYSNFNFTIPEAFKLSITNDTKLHVFRFGSSDFRLIGYKSRYCQPTLYILAIDYNYSAYKH